MARAAAADHPVPDVVGRRRRGRGGGRGRGRGRGRRGRGRRRRDRRGHRARDVGPGRGDVVRQRGGIDARLLGDLAPAGAGAPRGNDLLQRMAAARREAMGDEEVAPPEPRGRTRGAHLGRRPGERRGHPRHRRRLAARRGGATVDGGGKRVEPVLRVGGAGGERDDEQREQRAHVRRVCRARRLCTIAA
ncbi:MAG: hypothetical protein DMD80_21480 [Candidatus Rokuibacteriota bacterium]|nr:MAG: hypothetical protein DMD80_21480 [Candidatus Rokubacteria bacterium]PYN22448.1 MAG: hypothetical protein DMD76_19675 [Candidatus Rokubacteria bacterium]